MVHGSEKHEKGMRASFIGRDMFGQIGACRYRCNADTAVADSSLVQGRSWDCAQGTPSSVIATKDGCTFAAGYWLWPFLAFSSWPTRLYHGRLGGCSAAGLSSLAIGQLELGRLAYLAGYWALAMAGW